MHAFRKTDRQTDGQTEFSSLDHVCIPCSAVKTAIKMQLCNDEKEAEKSKCNEVAAYIKKCRYVFAAIR